MQYVDDDMDETSKFDAPSNLYAPPASPIVPPNASIQRVSEADSIAKHRGYVDIADRFAGINVTYPKLRESPIFIKRHDVMFSSFI